VIELADIFHRHGAQYRDKYADRMPIAHRLVMKAIEQCRTEAMGGHVYHCHDCDETQYSYHSCKNRHCPKCQNGTAEEWLDRQQDLLLPVSYFMLTFTLPAELKHLARSNQKCIYNLLFRASAAATQKLANDSRFVGGQIGMIGMLHTWTRDLNYHPHVHYLVPGGGLSDDGQSWLPSREDFLVHVKPLSTLFQAKFRDALQQTELFDQVPAKVWDQDWVVHCKKVGDGVGALKYLAPYIFRVAISNNRILSFVDNKVTFRYTTSDTGKTQYCTVTAEEFIRRFLQHVLPKGFIKVRYYGFFSSGNRHRLHQVRRLLGGSVSVHAADNGQHDVSPTDQNLRCPKCGKEMQLMQKLRPQRFRPP
jgi:hypothetical protein